MTPRLGSLLIVLLASSALTACGIAGVKLSAPMEPVGAEAKTEQVQQLLTAAGDKAVVVSVPISKLVIKITPAKNDDKAPSSPSSTKDAKDSKDASDSGTSAVTQTVITATATYSVSVVPVADASTTFRATPINNFFSSNNFGVTKIANSDVATTATNEFTDQTQSRITAIGGIIVGALKLGAGFAAASPPGAPPAAPEDNCSAKAVDFVVEARPDAGAPTWQGFRVNEGCWRYALKVGARQKDILSRTAFRNLVTNGETVKAWPVPSCLEVKLFVAKTAEAGKAADEAQADVVVPLKIADPDYVRLVGIPDKGKIAMHPICDADVTDNATDRWSTAFDALSALETQAQAIENARQKSSSQ